MKLLLRSAMRYQKQHRLQTILTLFVTSLITATISVIFHIASGFKDQLRENAIRTVGEHHYYYYAQTGTKQAAIIRRMAAVWESDPWFSKVQLSEDEDTVKLYLTVSSPGLFTSKTMGKKVLAFEKTWFQSNPGETFWGPYSKHNWNLLVSYGDLYKANGMYTYLRIFFFLLGMISLTAVLTLVTLFRLSASRREREFALLISIGADQRQIRILILLESIFYYICSVPLGYGVGILFFYACKANVDVLMNALFHLPDVRLVIYIPFTAALIGCEACIILLSGWFTADKAAKKSPMELLKKTEDVHLSKSELRRNYVQNSNHEKDRHFSPDSSADVSIWKQAAKNTEKWLAKKTNQRFKKRNRFVLAALSVSLFLCMVLAGFQNYSSDMVQMQKSKQTWNIQINLESDDLEILEHAAAEIGRMSDGELKLIRSEYFEWNPPYPLSQIAEETELLKTDGRLPGIMIVCLSEEEWQNICEKNHIVLHEDLTEGIFLKAEQTWTKEGVLYKGIPFQIEEGDEILLSRVRRNDSSGHSITMNGGEMADDTADLSGQEDIPMTIAGVITEIPLYVDIQPATKLTILVPVNTFLELEPLRPHMQKGEPLHKIFLRAMSENAFMLEDEVQKFLDSQDPGQMTGSVVNDEKILAGERDAIKSFQFLCTALIILLTMVSICGNFSVSWSTNAARQKEFAALMSIGLTPGSFKQMKLWEIAYRILSAFLPGFLGGMISYWIIYKIFRAEYMVTWIFPWNGLLLGVFVVAVSAITAEIAAKFSAAHFTMADILREADE